METNLRNFINKLKKKTTKQTNTELYKLMINNINNKVEHKKYRDQLIINNVRLVIQKVMEYIKNTKLLIFDDLVQEGIIGLTKSIETYNPNLKYNFSTLASIHIKKYVLRYMDSMYMPKPHTQITENIDRVRKIENKLYYKLKRNPTAEEIKEELDNIMKAKSKLNKKLNKKRLKDSLTPLSEQIGVDKDGKFAGININIIRYIRDVINNNCIMHSINMEQRGGTTLDLSLNDIDNSHYIMDTQDSLIGNVMYSDMYEDVLSLISDLPLRHAEIIDMIVGVSYSRPYTLEEIRTVLYNTYDKRSYKYTLPIISRLTKMCFNRLKRMEEDGDNRTS